nr:MAG TPA: hypothetical protein [Caudoviricetes sp.]
METVVNNYHFKNNLTQSDINEINLSQSILDMSSGLLSKYRPFKLFNSYVFLDRNLCSFNYIEIDDSNLLWMFGMYIDIKDLLIVLDVVDIGKSVVTFSLMDILNFIGIKVSQDNIVKALLDYKLNEDKVECWKKLYPDIYNFKGLSIFRIMLEKSAGKEPFDEKLWGKFIRAMLEISNINNSFRHMLRIMFNHLDFSNSYKAELYWNIKALPQEVNLTGYEEALKDPSDYNGKITALNDYEYTIGKPLLDYYNVLYYKPTKLDKNKEDRKSDALVEVAKLFDVSIDDYLEVQSLDDIPEMKGLFRGDISLFNSSKNNLLLGLDRRSYPNTRVFSNIRFRNQDENTVAVGLGEIVFIFKNLRKAVDYVIVNR